MAQAFVSANLAQMIVNNLKTWRLHWYKRLLARCEMDQVNWRTQAFQENLHAL
jgi:hypothetical protein